MGYLILPKSIVDICHRWIGYQAFKAIRFTNNQLTNLPITTPSLVPAQSFKKYNSGTYSAQRCTDKCDIVSYRGAPSEL